MRRRLLLPLIAVIAVCSRGSSLPAEPIIATPTGSGIRYSTALDAREFPISEGGKWEQNNPWFTKVVTNGGIAYGTSPRPAIPAKYRDSYAILKGLGFPPDQYASGHIYKGVTDGFMEVELLLRASDTGNSTQAYECYLQQGGAYITIARWRGEPMDAPAPLSYFDELARRENIIAPQGGDLFEAWIVGNIITVKLAGRLLLTVDVSRFDGKVIATGQPGMGFNLGHSGLEATNSGYGLRDFAAMGL